MRGRKKEKAFTLVEIIAVIIIIGIVALIALPSVSQYIGSSKKTAYLSYENSMEEAARNSTIKCIKGEELVCDIPKDNESNTVYLSELVNKGYLEIMKNPDGEGFCDEDLSYVEISKVGNDFEYSACLYCGQYKTDKSLCTNYTMDNDDPVCGVKTGEGNRSRWINTNRTISVQCSDATSGCTRNVFSKTFTQTTADSTISIVDKSGNKVDCPVDVYVDKTVPTCELKIDGTYDSSLGWYTGEVNVQLQNMLDTDSKLLTYGIGTSLKDKDYNKQTSLNIKSGITTAIGYVKDNAGNEGVCTKSVRIGAERPKFDFRYGYQIYPNGETKTLSGITENGSNLKTTSTNPVITFSNLNKYTDVDKVVISLSGTIPSSTVGSLTYTGTSGNPSGTTTAPMASGSNKITFVLPKGTYSKLAIKLGELSGKTYNIEKIEVYTTNGGIFTNKNVTIKIDSIDTGVRTTGYSFDGGSSFNTQDYNTYTANASGSLITKNAGNLLSLPQEYSIVGIDKNNPTVSLRVYKTGTTTAVSSGTWSDKKLDFTLTSSGVGISGANIYYCVDTNNTCNPTTLVTSGNKVSLNNVGVYYIRYYIENKAGTKTTVASYTAKVDISTPTCTITSSNTNWTNQNVTLTITGQNTGASTIDSYSWDGGTTFNTTRTKTVTTNGTYTAKVKNSAGTIGTCSLAVNNIDKSNPTVSLAVYKTGTTTAVSSGTWSDKKLDIKLTSASVGLSGATIYYCVDTNNSCNPTTTATSGSTIKLDNTGTFYVRYKIQNPAGTSTAVASYTGKVDITTPTCTIASSNTSWTNQNVTLTITGQNTGASTIDSYSWDGTTYNGTRTKTVTANGTFTGRVKNSAGTVGTCTITVGNIDKSNPTVTIATYKTGTTTGVSSGTWSDKKLDVKFTSGSVGISGADIYYCVDAANTCSPSTKATSGSTIKLDKTGTFYVRYKIQNPAGSFTSVASYTGKVDVSVPTCTLKAEGTKYTGTNRFLTNATVSFATTNDTGGSNISSYGIGSVTGSKTATHSDNKTTTYTGYIKDGAGNVGTCTISVEKNSVMTLTYNNNSGSGCTSKNITYNTQYGTLCTPTRSAYIFQGWYTSASGGSKITATSTVTVTANQTIFAHWTPACPAGYTVGTNNCYKTYTAYTNYSCPTGYTRSGTTCSKNESQNATIASYSCDSGWTVSGSNCTRRLTQNASVSYSCPSGGSLSGTTCYTSSSYTATATFTGYSGGCSWSADDGHYNSNGNYPSGLVSSLGDCSASNEGAQKKKKSCTNKAYMCGSVYRCSKYNPCNKTPKNTRVAEWKVYTCTCSGYAQYSYSCPYGGSLSGTTCYTSSSYGATPNYSCPSGYSRSGTTCYKDESKAATPNYTCPSGWTRSGTTCSRTLTQNADVYYTCDSGDSRNGQTCTHTVPFGS